MARCYSSSRPKEATPLILALIVTLMVIGRRGRQAERANRKNLRTVDRRASGCGNGQCNPKRPRLAGFEQLGMA